MGVSTDGLIFFGILIPEDSDTHERIEREKRAGPDGEPNPGTLGWLAWMGDDDDGVEIGTHCSGNNPMYYVAIKKSSVKAWRGYPMELGAHPIHGAYIDREGEWRFRIVNFCARWDIPFHEPSWYLASFWG